LASVATESLGFVQAVNEREINDNDTRIFFIERDG
jgi:hypothetical protein